MNTRRFPRSLSRTRRTSGPIQRTQRFAGGAAGEFSGGGFTESARGASGSRLSRCIDSRAATVVARRGRQTSGDPA